MQEKGLVFEQSFFFWYRMAFKSVSAFKNSSRTHALCESITRDGRGLHLQNAVRSCVMAVTHPHRIFPALSKSLPACLRGFFFLAKLVF